MKRTVISIFILMLSFFLGILCKSLYDNYSYYDSLRVISHKDTGLLNLIDVVPDEKTALKIAKSVWLPLYGKHLFGYSYKAILVEEEKWVIAGSKRIHILLNIMGGGPYIEIDKKTGTILQLGHTGAEPNL